MLITYHCCSSVHFGFVELIGFLDPVIGTLVSVLTGHMYFLYSCINVFLFLTLFEHGCNYLFFSSFFCLTVSCNKNNLFCMLFLKQ